MKRVWWVAVVLATMIAVSARAQTTRYWLTGNTASNWFDGANWTGGQSPQAGDSAVIASNAYVMLTNATPALATVTITNATVCFSNWTTKLTVQDFYVQKSGKLTHTANSDTNGADGWQPDARVYVVCTNLTVDGGGSINCNSCGYLGWGAWGVGYASTNGCGPGGGGFDFGTQGPGGGGYGGVGGATPTRGLPGQPYGSATNPADPGSGGGGDKTHLEGYGGPGGGVVRIEATRAVTNNGSITCNGGSGANGNFASGSGGAISIVCDTFGGTGTVSAIGASAGWGGGGSGGRIAIRYLSGVNWTGRLQTDYGLTRAPNNFDNELGTLYVPDECIITETPSYHRYCLYGVTNWTPVAPVFNSSFIQFMETGVVFSTAGSLVISNSSQLNFPCNVGVATDVLLLAGSTLKLIPTTPSNMICLTVGRDVAANGGQIVLGADAESNSVSFTVGRDATFTSNSLWIYAGVTNPLSPLAPWGGLYSVAGSLSLQSGATNYIYSHPTNGGSVRITANSLTVQSNALFNANGAGWAGGQGTVYTNGWGPGFGRGNSASGGGGGYGGHGGNCAQGTRGAGGVTYGDSNAPALPGSGGGMEVGFNSVGGRGGGLVWLEVQRNVLLDGGITANGASGTANPGAGSGGGIYLRCRQLTGNGSLSAHGGDWVGWTGVGGGGRIAVWRMNTNTLPANVACGTTNGVPSGWEPYGQQDGTVVWGMIRASGTIFVVH